MVNESAGPNGAARKVARGADLIIPALAVAFTVYFLTSVSGLAWEARANGTVIGITLIALVAVQAVRILLEIRRGEANLSFAPLGAWSRSQLRRLLIIAILAVFVAVVGWTGTTLGLFLVMLASMWVLGVRRAKLLVGVPLATAAAGYVLFIALLGTHFPAGPVEHALAALFGIR